MTVILPVFNEEDNIEVVATGLLKELSDAGYTPQLFLVDDGSSDGTPDAFARLKDANDAVNYIIFSKNFGKEIAILAGIKEVTDDFDVLAYMDSDGQHTSADLIRLIEAAQTTGAHIVCGARVDREYQTILQKWAAEKFYDVFNSLSKDKIEAGIGDFNVLRPKAVQAVRQLSEDRPFMKGLISWVGFDRISIPITIEPRMMGEAKTSTLKMVKFAINAIFSFSAWPLRAWSVIGLCSALLALIYLLFVVLQTIVFGRDVPGYATLVVLLLGVGGIQLLSAGILGEYIGRTYEASKKRPQYLIKAASNERSSK